MEYWSAFDFRFWNLDFGLKLVEGDTQKLSGLLNPKSTI